MAWLEWQNFLFLAPLLAGLLFVMLTMLTGGIGDGESSEIADGTEAAGFDFLGWFGVGQGVSLSLLLPVLLSIFGLTGLVLNTFILEPVFRMAWLYAPIAILGGLFAASLAGRAFAKGFARAINANLKTSVKNSSDFVGCTGTTVFEVDSLQGAANIKDAFGNIHRVAARATTPIAANIAVRVARVEQSIFWLQVQEEDL
jgi:hypothetical protein